MRGFSALALLAALCFALVGCGNPEPEGKLPGDATPDNTSSPEQVESASAPAPSGSGSVGIQGGASGAGGMAPVTGTENLQGGGSGVGAAAKDQARDVAGSMGTGSAGQMGTEGE
jgi:hypothetical protein